MVDAGLHFNPRSPYGERPVFRAIPASTKGFQSTLPVRGATRYPVVPRIHIQISIHAPRTGSDGNIQRIRRGTGISIHAPRTGSDPKTFPTETAEKDFNPRSPYGERRQIVGVVRPNYQFQSTLPVRGATAAATGLFPSFAISIHAPRTGSDPRSAPSFRWWVISIHAPRTGSDPGPTLPGQSGLLISIHAPRTGSDSKLLARKQSGTYFNPRSPYGERQDNNTTGHGPGDFNPRSPYGERRQIRSLSV